MWKLQFISKLPTEKWSCCKRFAQYLSKEQQILHLQIFLEREGIKLSPTKSHPSEIYISGVGFFVLVKIRDQQLYTSTV